jgi:hypothetical protein
MMGPDRLDDGLKNWERDAPTCLTCAQRTPSAICIVVTNPNCHGDVIREAYEPGVVLAVGGASLACYVGRKMCDASRRPAL